MKLNIKALSVNKVWQGKRFKTGEYKNYERDLLALLPSSYAIPDGDLVLHVTFGYSSKLADFDNGVKPFVDVLQKKYGFDDRRIKQAYIDVDNDVKKGEEYIKFELEEVKNGTKRCK